MKLAALAIFLYCSHAATFMVHAKIFSTPLKRIESGREKMMKAGRWADYKSSKKSLQHKGQDIKDFNDMMYIGEMTVGTPGQKFRIVMDTGSANFWVPDSTCGSKFCPKDKCTSPWLCEQFTECCQCDMCQGRGWCDHAEPPAATNPCDSKTLFESSTSTTYASKNKKFYINYGSGSASGIWGTDAVCQKSHGLEYLCAEKQEFGQVTNMAQVFADFPFDGICGLAWPKISVDHATPYFQHIMSSLDQQLFTVWLTEAQSGQIGGEITFGGLDGKHCDSKVHYTSLSSDAVVPTYWEFKIHGVFSGKFSQIRPWDVMSDSGSSFIAGPTKTIQSIVKEIGGVFSKDLGVYTIDCSAKTNEAINVKFRINGEEFVVEPKNLVLDIPGGGGCMLGLENYDGLIPQWIFGDVWIRQFCNIYDVQNKRIGFSKPL